MRVLASLLEWILDFDSAAWFLAIPTAISIVVGDSASLDLQDQQSAIGMYNQQIGFAFAQRDLALTSFRSERSQG